MCIRDSTHTHTLAYWLNSFYNYAWRNEIHQHHILMCMLHFVECWYSLFSCCIECMLLFVCLDIFKHIHTHLPFLLFITVSRLPYYLTLNYIKVAYIDKGSILNWLCDIIQFYLTNFTATITITIKVICISCTETYPLPTLYQACFLYNIYCKYI